ncbi:MAG: response regulator [Pirellulaceae bacterium]
MKVLIVDDSKAMRMIIQRTLKQAGFGGHNYIEAENGKHALEVIEQEHPETILSDWNMPEMKGIELLRALRDKGINTRFGFITSESGTEILQEAKAAGAEFLITKPFTPDRFAAELEDVLG